ncbi:unnamed protein product [Adineta steineri]|uniref:Nuclear receptor domain-containing protein n=2 Tax=Adineta steineri TaxID=433720 RepID=A0A818UFN3_9BILA|nr:unnamed protein product [Adineta steineri]CAF3692528.1 unnamed protein product [Adineta steineri]
MTTTMLNDEFWNKIENSVLLFSNEFPMNPDDYLFTEDADCLKSGNISSEEDFEKMLSSPEADHYSLQASSTHSPDIEIDPLNLICCVCGAPAHGYNFDQITCESCKAFFRRNALKNTSNFKCRFAGCCVINISTRRQCTYCRLKKCFDVNMRKEWIRTDEERELRLLKNLQKEQRKLNKSSADHQLMVKLPIVIRKKKRILPATAKLVSQAFVIPKICKLNSFGVHRNLSADDKTLLNNIICAYKYGADQADSSHVNRYTSSSSLTQFINDESINHKSLIYFYKHIPEFRQLDTDDQVLLIKCNMVDIIHLHLVIVQNFHENSKMAEHMSQWISLDFHRQMSGTRQKFDRFMKYPAILQIALIVLIFSFNLSTPRGSSESMNYISKRKLYESQNYYVSLLWRYLNYLFDEQEAIRSMVLIVMQILHYQVLMTIMDEMLQKSGMEDMLNPLMQSIFGLT